jgi:cell division septum initiation protein DivIVA
VRTFSGDRKSTDPAPVKGEPFPDDVSEDGTWAAVLPRFPITRQGYDTVAVDGYVAQLEAELTELDQELADLRSGAASGSGATAEIERIGGQASAILLAAHDSARDMTEAAQTRADRCISEAEANAAAITADGSRQLSELQSKMEALRREQDEILEDVRRTADALSALAAARELH